MSDARISNTGEFSWLVGVALELLLDGKKSCCKYEMFSKARKCACVVGGGLGSGIVQVGIGQGGIC